MQMLSSLCAAPLPKLMESDGWGVCLRVGYTFHNEHGIYSMIFILPSETIFFVQIISCVIDRGTYVWGCAWIINR